MFPDRALEENSFNLLFLRVFPLDRSVFQNSSISRQLLAKHSWWRWSFINNLLHKRIPSRWPCSDWLPANVVFEVQAHAVTQSMRILNFIASNSGAYDVLIQSKFSLKWKFTKKKACWALRWRCSRISHPSEWNFLRLFRIEFSVTLLTHTNAVPLTILWHRHCITDRKTFSFFSFSLSCDGFPIACFLCFLFKIKIIMRNVRNREFKHCGNIELSNVLVRGFSRSRRCGPDRWWASCHHPRKYSCRTCWAHNLF